MQLGANDLDHGLGLLSHSPSMTSGVAGDDYPWRPATGIGAGNKVPPHSKPKQPQDTIFNCTGNLRRRQSPRIPAARRHTGFMQDLYTIRSASFVARRCRPDEAVRLQLKLRLEHALLDRGALKTDSRAACFLGRYVFSLTENARCARLNRRLFNAVLLIGREGGQKPS
jgi:hypothetical protein